MPTGVKRAPAALRDSRRGGAGADRARAAGTPPRSTGYWPACRGRVLVSTARIKALVDRTGRYRNSPSPQEDRTQTALRYVVDQVAFLSLRSCEWARAYY